MTAVDAVNVAINPVNALTHLAYRPPGASVELTVVRGGRSVRLDVKPGTN